MSVEGGDRQPTENLSKQQKTPDWPKTNRAHRHIKSQKPTQYTTHSTPDLPGGGATLFLAGADHVCYEKEKYTLRYLLGAAV